MIKEIRYGGLSNVPGDSDCPDGDLAVMVDVVNERGEIKPFLHPDTILQIAGVLMCVHKGSSYENYITLADGTLYSQTIDGSPAIIMGDAADVIKIEQIGNTLIVIAKDRPIRYLLYKSEGYKYLGEKPQFPYIRFGVYATSGIEEAFSPGISLGTARELSDEDQVSVTNTYFSHINKMVADELAENRCPFPRLIRYALRLYDGSLIMHSAPILLVVDAHSDPAPTTPGYDGVHVTYDGDNTANAKVYVESRGYQMSWGGYHDDWADVVTSVDIFLSEPIYTYDPSRKITTLKTEDVADFDFPYLSADEIRKSIEDTAQFFKIYSIPTSGKFADFNDQDVSLGFYTNDFTYMLPENMLKNLATQEQMEDDYRSHHGIGASTSYVYNSRLHLGNIISRLSSGFNLEEMGAQPRTVVPYSGAFIRVWINTESGIKVVKRDLIEMTSESIYYLFYPDSRAYKMEIALQWHPASDPGAPVVIEGWYGYTVDLKSHPFLNGAFYATPIDAPLITTSRMWLIRGLETTPSSTEMIPNRIQVSESNNPFIFRALQSYTIGTADVRAIASSTRTVSQGQFGQFPLYLFSGEGIWALEVSDTGTYSSRQMVARDVYNNGNSVLQVDGAVVFTTDRGVMLIQGSEVIGISDIIDGPTFDLGQLAHIEQVIEKEELTGLVDAIDSVPLSEFLEGCRMAYDYAHSRIIVINPAFNYAYAFSIESKTWSVITGAYVAETNNYPDSYLTDNAGNVYNLSAVISEDDPREVLGMMITRPLKLDAPDDLKTISAIAHRGHFPDEKLSSVLYGSRDGFRYTPIASSTGRYLRRMHGSPYRYFRLAVIVRLSRRHSLARTVIDYALKMVNKLR